MAKRKSGGMVFDGCVRLADVTVYSRQGSVVYRRAHSLQPKRRSRAQFDVRMRTRHSIALWQMLKMSGTTLFYGGKSAYSCFLSLAFRLPVVYLPSTVSASLLLPEMPVSDGTLPPVKQRLGELEGMAALLTDLRREDVKRFDTLLLYTLHQCIEDKTPRVRISVREVAVGEMVEADGMLALTGDEFADTMRGWALVHVSGDRCSSQTAVTHCTYYQRYTTEEALQAAIKSYGGFIEKR